MDNHFVNRDYPPLNKSKQSLPLKLFNSQGAIFHQLMNCKIDLPGCSSFILRGIFLSQEFYM